MLHLVLGRSGSGKTEYLRSQAAQLAEKEQKVMLLVPEQYSFETERAVLHRLGPQKARFIEVTSFTRLCDLVMRQTGGLAGRRLDDGGRNILMALALEGVKDRLTLFRRQADSIELVNRMLSALSEFKMCGISPQQLRGVAQELDEGNLRQKAEETALVLEAYDALIAQSYLDPLDDLTRLAGCLERFDFFAEYTVLLDAFNGFTMQEFSVLRWVMRQAQDLYISLCIDPFALHNTQDKLGLFASVRATASALMRLAKQNGVGIAVPVELSSPHRFAGEDLAWVERYLFRPEKEVYSGAVEHVTLYAAADPYSEAEYVARTIRRMVMEQGLHYRDFAVLCRDTGAYQGILDAALEKYEIPCFMDRREPIDAKPLMNLVLTAFEVVQSGYRSDLLFCYLKTGLAGLDVEEISVLENYVLLWGLSGNRLKQPFTGHPEGFAGQMTPKDEETLQSLNALRCRAMDPLLAFEKRIAQTDGEGMARAVYRLLQEVDAPQRLKELAAGLEAAGEFNLADEQLRLWDLLMQILDQTALVIGTTAISSKRYMELLRLVVNTGDIGFIPQGLDEVAVGTADRSRPVNPPYLFVIGAVEGEFPRTPVPAGVFSDAERRLLLAQGLPMYDSLEGLALEERFLAYTAVTAGGRHLFLSWHTADCAGKDCSPSILVREIQGILPGVAVSDDFAAPDSQAVWAQRPAFEYAARYWRDTSPVADTLKLYFQQQDDYQGKIEALQRVVSDRQVYLEPQAAKRLFGGQKKLSASQVERFYLCKFQYFCRYGLRAKERRPASFDALEYGSLMHFLLEHILARYSGRALAALPQQELRQELAGLLEDYVQQQLGGWEDKSPRFRFLYSRLSATAEVLIRHIGEELAQSEFTPVDYELQIQEGGPVEPLHVVLPGGEQVAVEGKVDRVDIMEKDGVKYVRVVDYKTGSKDFRLSDVLYGLNMQMILYLAAVWENGTKRYGKVLPAGVLYMPAGKPLVSADRDVPSERVQAQLQRKLRMNGLVLEDPTVLRGMEAQAQGVFIPVALKDGQPAKLDSVASLTQMGVLVKHIEHLIEGMAKTLYAGDVRPEPASGEYDACAWCPYGAVCGHEKDDGTDRPVQRWDRDEVFRRMETEESEKANSNGQEEE